jgi:hypothetical protein
VKASTADALNAQVGHGVLTKLDLEYNFMRYAQGKQAVRDAVKDRSGFVLHLSFH